MLEVDVSIPLTTLEYEGFETAFEANSLEPAMKGRHLVLARGIFEEQGGHLVLQSRGYEGVADATMRLSLPATRVKAAEAARHLL